MKSKIICFFVITLLILSFIIPASAITIGNNKPLSSNSLTVTLHSNEYKINNLGNNQVEIYMEDYGNIVKPGEPVIPMKTFFVGLPPGGKVTSIELIGFDSEELSGFYNIKPGLFINNENMEINIDIYNSNKPYPAEIFEYSGMSQMRKYSIAVICFSPFTYYPLEGKIVLHKSITIKINYELAEKLSDILLSDTASDDLASDIIVNYDSIAKYYTSSQQSRQTYDYVIITTAPVTTALTGFLNWKTSIGYNVNIVTLSWITTNYPAVDTQKSIRDFLVANYASWGIKYVLIVGTHASIPMRMCWPDPTNHIADGIHDIPTDYYYADLTGSWDSDSDGFYGERGQDSVDFLPEVYVGRIPTDGTGAVTSITFKIQQFEQTAYSGWKKNAMLLGAMYMYANEDNGGNPKWDGAEVMEQCKNNLLSGFSVTTMYEQMGLSPSPLPCTMGLTNANIVAQWGSTTGWGIINWAAHGLPASASQKVWNSDDGDSIPENNGEIIWPIMIQNSDNGLLNNGKPPIVFAASCFVSHPESVNLGISILTSGASAFIGASRTSWGSMGWTQPAHGGHGTVCYDFTDRIANKNEDCGHALYNAKQYVYNNIPWNLWQDEANMYNFNLYGDPSMGMNLAPSAPFQPSGPSSGITGISYTYSTYTFDPTGDKVKYGWDWNGDGTVDQWDDNGGNYYVSGPPSVSIQHTFATPGTYNVQVKAEDIYGKQGAFSIPLSVTITQNQPPTKPTKPSGTASGNIGVLYPYSTSANDPESYKVAYGWDWNGDGTVDQWDDNGGNYYTSGQTITTSHSWSTKGTYKILVKAKDIHGNEGPWSDPLEVNMPRIRVTFIHRLTGLFPNMLPLLRHILNL